MLNLIIWKHVHDPTIPLPNPPQSNIQLAKYRHIYRMCVQLFPLLRKYV